MHIIRNSHVTRVDPTLTPYEWAQWATERGYDLTDPTDARVARMSWAMLYTEATLFAAWLPRT